jgi:hypothetical protein
LFSNLKSPRGRIFVPGVFISKETHCCKFYLYYCNFSNKRATLYLTSSPRVLTNQHLLLLVTFELADLGLFENIKWLPLHLVSWLSLEVSNIHSSCCTKIKGGGPSLLGFLNGSWCKLMFKPVHLAVCLFLSHCLLALLEVLVKISTMSFVQLRRSENNYNLCKWCSNVCECFLYE